MLEQLLAENEYYAMDEVDMNIIVADEDDI